MCSNHLKLALDGADPVNNSYKSEVLTFSLIIYLAATSKAPGFRVPRMLGTIAEDAAWYFVVMFASHFALLMTLTLGRVSAAIFSPDDANNIQCASLGHHPSSSCSVSCRWPNLNTIALIMHLSPRSEATPCKFRVMFAYSNDQ